MPDKCETLPAFIPVPRLKNRANGWKPEVQLAFIEALAETGSVRAACRRVGRADHGAYLLRRHPDAAEFRRAWDAALDIGLRRIEDVAMERALHGVEVPVYSYGKLVGTRTVHNDRLLMFMLRNRAPERFTEGRARSLSALDDQQLERHNRRWRKEWEAERGIRRVSVAEVRASIDRKIAALRRQVLADRSPAGYEAELAAAAQRRAGDAAGWTAGEPYAPYAERAAALLPECLAQVRAEWPSYEDAMADLAEPDADDDTATRAPPGWRQKALPPAGRRVRKLKDEAW